MPEDQGVCGDGRYALLAQQPRAGDQQVYCADEVFASGAMATMLAIARNTFADRNAATHKRKST